MKKLILKVAFLLGAMTLNAQEMSSLLITRIDDQKLENRIYGLTAENDKKNHRLLNLLNVT